MTTLRNPRPSHVLMAAAGPDHPASIVVDFDETLTKKSPSFEEIGEPRPEVIERVRRAHAAGVKVIIQSCRWSVHELSTPERAEAWKAIAAAWLEEHQVPFDEMRGEKPLAEVYLDDRAMRPDDLERLDLFISDAEARAGGGTEMRDRVVSGAYLMAPCPDSLAQDLLAFSKANIPADIIYEKEDDNPLERFGYELEPHATVVYGIPMAEALGGLQMFLQDMQPGPAPIKLGKIIKFRPKDKPYDVLVVEVESDSPNGLVALNAVLKEFYETDDTFPDYKPHLTLAYVHKGQAEWLDGSEAFLGQEHLLDTILCKRCGAPGTVFVHAPGFPVEGSQKTQTESPEFKSWFGGSKVVDSAGKPLRVYHGTVQDFKEFSKAPYGGYFFSDSTNMASAKAEHNTASSQVGPEGANVKPVYLSLKNPREYDEQIQVFNQGRIIEQAKKDGFDGLIYPDYAGTKTYVAFSPEQIKSATGNRGSFDPQTANLTASLIDFPRPTLPKEMWDVRDDGRGDAFAKPEQYFLRPAIRNAILSAVYGMLDFNFKGRESWLADVVTGGSASTQFFNNSTDIDIKMAIKEKEFLATNPEFAGASGQDLNDEMFRKIADNHSQQYWIGSHPIEFYLFPASWLQSDEYVDAHYDSLWSLNDNRWIREPKLVDPKTWDREAVIAPGEKLALKWANEWDVLFGGIRKTVRDVLLTLEYVENTPPEVSVTTESKMGNDCLWLTTAIKKLAEDKEGLIATRRDSYTGSKNNFADMVNADPEVIQLKLLAHWGYLDAIKKLMAILGDDEHAVITPGQAKHVAAVFNVQAPVVQTKHPDPEVAAMRPLAAAGDSNFWLNTKTGELIRCGLHYDEDRVMSKYDYEEDDKWGGVQMAMEDGWVRGYKSGGELGLDISTKYSKNVERILGLLPSEFLFVKELFVDFDNFGPLEGLAEKSDDSFSEPIPAIPVLEGEDALSAWQHRNDIRHRVNGAGKKAMKFFISPSQDFYEFGFGQEHDAMIEDITKGRFLESGEAVIEGWIQGYLAPNSELGLDVYAEEDVEGALLSLPTTVIVQAKKLVVDIAGTGLEVPILEGEDAIQAWKRRKDIRHRVQGALEPRKTKSFKTDEGKFSVHDIEKDAPRADMFTVHESPEGWVVRNALLPESMRRQGVATDFYKKMNAASIAATGKPLRSTQPRTLGTGEVVHELSSDGIALWDSFVVKGLAEKLGEKNYVFKAGIQAGYPKPGETKNASAEEAYRIAMNYGPMWSKPGYPKESVELASIPQDEYPEPPAKKSAMEIYEQALADSKELPKGHGMITGESKNEFGLWQGSANKFWVNAKTGEIHLCHGENTHLQDWCEWHDLDWEKFEQRTDPYSMPSRQEWYRGTLVPGKELDLGIMGDESDVLQVLSKLPHHYLFVKNLFVDLGSVADMAGDKTESDPQDAIPVLDGEDALEAWKRRKDARHRVKAEKDQGTPYWWDGSNLLPIEANKTHDEWAREHKGVAGQVLINRGFVRIVYFPKAGLVLGAHNEDAITSALHHLPHEMLMVSQVVTDFGSPEVLEGEDALQAWKRRKDVRHRIEGFQIPSTGKFWLNLKDGQLIPCTEYTHIEQFYETILKKEIPEDDQEWPPLIYRIQQKGWVRGHVIPGKELNIGIKDEASVEKALSLLPAELLFVKEILVTTKSADLEDANHTDGVEVPVLEGEDALSAWQHRNDIRHRIKASWEPHPNAKPLKDPEASFGRMELMFSNTNFHHGQYDFKTVAFDNEDPNGFLGYIDSVLFQDRISFAMVWVRPELRRRGIAKKMADLTIAEIKKVAPEAKLEKSSVMTDEGAAFHKSVSADLNTSPRWPANLGRFWVDPSGEIQDLENGEQHTEFAKRHLPKAKDPFWQLIKAGWTSFTLDGITTNEAAWPRVREIILSLVPKDEWDSSTVMIWWEGRPKANNQSSTIRQVSNARSLKDLESPSVQAASDVWYHGSMESRTSLRPGTYFAKSPKEAAAFGPVIHKVILPAGKVRNIDDEVLDALENGDVEKVIAEIAATEKEADYLEFNHPSSVEASADMDFTARVTTKMTVLVKAVTKDFSGKVWKLGASFTAQSESEFKAWFDGSKAVDAKGNPLVFYHGTDRHVDRLEPSKTGAMGPGIYFTVDPQSASDYAKVERRYKPGGGTPNVHKVYLKILKPFMISGVNKSSQEFFKHFDPEDKLDDAEVVDLAKKAGYDAVWAQWEGEVSVFSPDQVRTAIGIKLSAGIYEQLMETDPKFKASEELRRSNEAFMRRKDQTSEELNAFVLAQPRVEDDPTVIKNYRSHKVDEESSEHCELWDVDGSYVGVVFGRIVRLPLGPDGIRFFDKLKKLENLQKDVYEALGEASVSSWSEDPKGVFESTKVKQIGDRLIRKIIGEKDPMITVLKTIPKQLPERPIQIGDWVSWDKVADDYQTEYAGKNWREENHIVYLTAPASHFTDKQTGWAAGQTLVYVGPGKGDFKVTASRWNYFKASLGGMSLQAGLMLRAESESEAIARFLQEMIDSGDFEVSSRYGDGQDAIPDRANICNGPCEGMGVVPVYMRKGDRTTGSCIPADESDQELISLWEKAEVEKLGDGGDGWHFVECGECQGTGKAMAVAASTGGVKEDAFTTLYKKANELAQEMAKSSGAATGDPALAQQEGELQRLVSQARSEGELQTAWESHAHGLSWEALVALAESEK